MKKAILETMFWLERKFIGLVVCELTVEKSAQFGDKQSWQINQALAKRVKKVHRGAAIAIRLADAPAKKDARAQGFVTALVNPPIKRSLCC